MSQHVAIILAAGKGTRMQSDLPKVLYPVCGRSMIEYVVETLGRAGIERQIVVVGYRADLVRDALSGRPGIEFADQSEQLGTGHAVMVCREHLATVEPDAAVLIVVGDSPLLECDSVAALLKEFDAHHPSCILGTGFRDDPSGFGRILRDEGGDFERIIEQRDAGKEELAIREVNLSCYVFRCGDLLDALDRLTNDNAQGEYYITDAPAILKAAGRDVRAAAVLAPHEALSINTIEDVAVVEEEMARR